MDPSSEKSLTFYKKCEFEKKEIIKKLIDGGEKINGHDLYNGYKNYFNPLCSAIKGRNYEVIKLLLELGADPNAYYGKVYNFTYVSVDYPLHIAIINGYSEIVKLLVDFKADCNLREDLMDKACKYGNLDIVKILLPHLKEENYVCGLREASYRGYADIIDYYFEIFGNNSENFHKNYFIFMGGFEGACLVNRSEVIRLFIKHIEEKRIDNFNNFFEKCFIHALNSNIDFDTMMKIFVKCNPNYVNEDEENFIKISIKKENYDILNFLIDFCNLDYLTNSKFLLVDLCKSMRNFWKKIIDDEEDVNQNPFNSRDFERTFIKILNYCGPYMEDNDSRNALSYLKKDRRIFYKFITIIENYNL